jgi:hypothetical protein
VPGGQSRLGILEETGFSNDYGFIPAGDDPKVEDVYRSVIWSKAQAKELQELDYSIDVYQKQSAEDLELHAPVLYPSEKCSDGRLAVAFDKVIDEAKRHSADAVTYVGQLTQLLSNVTDQNVQLLLAAATTDI